MNKYIKTVLLGLIAWVVPFLASFFVWNTKTNSPSIDLAWFYALMGVTGAIGFALAAFFQFKNVKKGALKFGIITGIIWYVELIALDYVFLVMLFGMTLMSYSHLLLTYWTPAILSVLIGYLKEEK